MDRTQGQRGLGLGRNSLIAVISGATTSLNKQPGTGRGRHREQQCQGMPGQHRATKEERKIMKEGQEFHLGHSGAWWGLGMVIDWVRELEAWDVRLCSWNDSLRALHVTKY